MAWVLATSVTVSRFIDGSMVSCFFPLTWIAIINVSFCLIEIKLLLYLDKKTKQTHLNNLIIECFNHQLKNSKQLKQICTLRRLTMALKVHLTTHNTINTVNYNHHSSITKGCHLLC